MTQHKKPKLFLLLQPVQNNYNSINDMANRKSQIASCSSNWPLQEFEKFAKEKWN